MSTGSCQSRTRGTTGTQPSRTARKRTPTPSERSSQSWRIRQCGRFLAMVPERVELLDENLRMRKCSGPLGGRGFPPTGRSETSLEKDDLWDVPSERRSNPSHPLRPPHAFRHHVQPGLHRRVPLTIGGATRYRTLVSSAREEEASAFRSAAE